MTAPLTILLPLKGRPLHTLRFLWHAERCRLPYHFFIADGQVNPAIARLLENPAAAFPHLDIEYVRYPDDASFSHFFRKMADAAARVRTPYVMQVDNDDFLMRGGVDWCVDFLDANPAYVSCGAGVGGFSLRAATDPALHDVAAPIDRLAFRYGPHYEPRDLSAASAVERIVACGTYFGPVYYNVFRAEALATITREIAEIDFSDLELHEAFFCMRTLTLGAMRSEGSTMSYLRQRGTTMASAYAGRDWVAHLLASNFCGDFAAMTAHLAAAVSRTDGTDAKTFVQEVRNIYGEKLRGDLRHRYRTLPSGRAAYHPLSLIKTAMQHMGLAWLLQLYRDLAERRLQARKVGPGIAAEREEVCAGLRAWGASDDGVARFRSELAAAEEALCAPHFMAFARRHVPEFLTDGASKPASAQQEAAV